jgi:hypothetical protein
VRSSVREITGAERRVLQGVVFADVPHQLMCKLPQVKRSAGGMGPQLTHLMFGRWMRMLFVVYNIRGQAMNTTSAGNNRAVQKAQSFESQLLELSSKS